jgi:large subunit ribosomal protein L22
MESIARTRHVRISPQKLRLVCELIVGKKIDLALSVLEFTAKRSAKVVSKTLLAAVANARDQQNVDEDLLYVKRATADTGPTWKRSLARAHMHSTPILRNRIRAGCGSASSRVGIPSGTRRTTTRCCCTRI